MISINALNVQFAGIDLFKDISFIINPKDRIGLVGKNGVGKSTLLKILASQQNATSGSVVIPEGQRVGYLPQEIKLDSNKTIYNETLTVFDEINQLEKDIDDIGVQLAERTDYESDSYSALIESLNDKHERFAILDGNKKESNVERILKGLGFNSEDFDRKVSEFSGGWQMRVELSKLLLVMPELLLLDEPTNHLDIESIMWLEEFFKSYPGAIMMVSHDRMFLDNITNRTIEIVFGKIYDFKVPYTKYFELREERLETQRSAYKNQQKYIATQERFIERFKAKNTKAKQAQSKMKQLEKIERIEFDEIDNTTIQFRFPKAIRSGDVVIRGQRISKSYDDNLILDDIDIEIERGDKVAFVGKNGQGKTTLVKMIMKQLAHKGKLTIGHNVEIGYYAQIQDNTMDGNLTVLETIENEATGDWSKINKIRGLLGAFLFGPNDVDKKVKVLSGGEKSRLAIAQLLLKEINLLILDEPTNHLDIPSKNVLKQALKDYTGTLILVSHDRDFLKDLTTKSYEFGNRKIKERIGSIDEFLVAHKVDTFRDFEADNLAKKAKVEKKESIQQVNFKTRKELDKKVRNCRKEISKIEKKIEIIEECIKAFETNLADPSKYRELISDKDAYSDYEYDKKELTEFMEKWEIQVEKLSKLESKLEAES